MELTLSHVKIQRSVQCEKASVEPSRLQLSISLEVPGLETDICPEHWILCTKDPDRYIEVVFVLPHLLGCSVPWERLGWAGTMIAGRTLGRSKWARAAAMAIDPPTTMSLHKGFGVQMSCALYKLGSWLVSIGSEPVFDMPGCAYSTRRYAHRSHVIL